MTTQADLHYQMMGRLSPPSHDEMMPVSGLTPLLSRSQPGSVKASVQLVLRQHGTWANELPTGTRPQPSIEPGDIGCWPAVPRGFARLQSLMLEKYCIRGGPAVRNEKAVSSQQLSPSISLDRQRCQPHERKDQRSEPRQQRGHREQLAQAAHLVAQCSSDHGGGDCWFKGFAPVFWLIPRCLADRGRRPVSTAST